MCVGSESVGASGGDWARLGEVMEGQGEFGRTGRAEASVVEVCMVGMGARRSREAW